MVMFVVKALTEKGAVAIRAFTDKSRADSFASQQEEKSKHIYVVDTVEASTK